jgi:hypothetical protein
LSDLLPNVNDTYPGGPQTGGSGVTIARNPGMVGGMYYLTEAEAAARYGSQTVPLYGGIYQYVQVLSTAVAAPAVGQICFWNSATNAQSYIVTSDATAANASRWAGIFLGSITQGNYGWIQIAGIATVLFGTCTKATPADGDLVYVNATPSNKADVLADATTLTPPALKLKLGKAIGAPNSTTKSLVLLENGQWNF